MSIVSIQTFKRKDLFSKLNLDYHWNIGFSTKHFIHPDTDVWDLFQMHIQHSKAESNLNTKTLIIDNQFKKVLDLSTDLLEAFENRFRFSFFIKYFTKLNLSEYFFRKKYAKDHIDYYRKLQKELSDPTFKDRLNDKYQSLISNSMNDDVQVIVPNLSVGDPIYIVKQHLDNFSLQYDEVLSLDLSGEYFANHEYTVSVNYGRKGDEYPERLSFDLNENGEPYFKNNHLNKQIFFTKDAAIEHLTKKKTHVDNQIKTLISELSSD